jgi:hypothetical protein
MSIDCLALVMLPPASAYALLERAMPQVGSGVA